MKKIIQLLLICPVLLLSQTTEQIKKAKDVIQKTGMSEGQARAAARAQGYSNKQIDNAIDKIKAKKTDPISSKVETSQKIKLSDFEKFNEIDQGQPSEETLTIDELSFPYDNKMEIEDEPNIEIESEAQPIKKRLNYFGYDIFKRDPALFQATSVGAVDPEYLIGPGDEIIVMLWGETQFRQVLTVDREGFVFIPEIGQVFVNGLNLNLLESKLFRVFSQSYASLNPQGRTPTTFLDVSLGNLRPLRIQVLGEVAQPGAYTVSPSATLFSALYYFNGPTTLGSLRDIQLIRAGEKITSIDFYDFLLTGKRPEDQKLQLDDVIFIPPRQKTVHIEGEINREGIYELKPDESLIDFISIAGDLKITAYLDRAQIDRIVPFKNRQELGMDRMFKDVNLEKILKADEIFQLKDGDRLQIFSILDLRQNVVELSGAVARPGIYDLGDSLSFSELINKADGTLGDAYQERVDIVRLKSDFTEELIKLNLGLALNGDPENDINLQGMDKIKVYGMTEMVSRTYVSIIGHVKQPGRYLLQENMKLYDLIFKAGGFIDQEFKERAYLERADIFRMNSDRISRSIVSFDLGELLSSPESEKNILLIADDIIKVYQKNIFKSPKPVSINGVVRNPGTYELKTNMNLKDLILEAGGFKENVYRYRVEVASIDPQNNNLKEFAQTTTFNINEKFSFEVETNEDLKNDLFIDSAYYILKPYDLISIRSDPYFSNQKQVTIKGEVLYPGNYTILNSEEKITDIIKRAGGLRPNANPDLSQYFRKGININTAFAKILSNPKSSLNFIVQDGDLISILPHSNIVNIIGEVNSPGVHKHVQGKRLKYYLNVSGGLSPDADRDNIWIEYPNGDSKRYGTWSILSPVVTDGSTVVIAREKEKEPFDRTEYAKELTSILANLAQAISIIYLATNQ